MKPNKLGFTNGAFDLLHIAHLRTLQFARAHCDRLVVGVNSDRSVRTLKGPRRPIHPERDRAEMLRALRPVDEVVIFDELTPLRLIEEICPDVLFKGGDYEGAEIVGAAFVRARGGVVMFAPVVLGAGTTGLIEAIRRNS